MLHSRRQFCSTLLAAAGSLSTRVLANPLGKPIGLQLYMVEPELAKDFAGTLHKVAQIGIKEVEIAATYGKSPSEWKTALKQSGLHCRSVHVYDPAQPPVEVMRFAADLGVEYVVTSLNAPPEILATVPGGKPDWQQLVKAVETMSAVDWKKSADVTNQLAAQAAQYGLKYAYHNHNVEFKKFGGATAYEMLLAGTDPAKVSFEMDCGWVSAAGYHPEKLLQTYPDRIRMLHIKSFQIGPPNLNLVGPREPKSAEIGHGQPNYKLIFDAAANAHIEQYYLEQEPPYVAMTALEAVRAGYNYLHQMS